MKRYFEIKGWINDNKVSTQYVDFDLIFKNSNPTFNPSKRQLHKYCNLKSIFNFRVVDGLPIYNQNRELIRVEY